MLCSKGTGQGQGQVKRRRLASPTVQLSTSQSDEGGCSVTPPGGFVSVCMEEVATRMSHLKIQGGGTRVVSESPKTRKRGTLQKRQLFPSSKRHALLPPLSLSEILALVHSCFSIRKATPGHLVMAMMLSGTMLEGLCRVVVLLISAERVSCKTYMH